MGQVGVRAASPLTLMREHLTALRALLAGEEVTVSGDYVTLDRVRLDWPPTTAPSLHAAGEGPRTLALTGEVADATILVQGQTLSQVREQARRVRDARAAVGREGPHTVVAYVTAAFGEGARHRVAADLGDRGTADDRGVWGDVDDVAAAVRRFAGAGVDAVVLVPTGGEPHLPTFLRAVGDVARLA